MKKESSAFEEVITTIIALPFAFVLLAFSLVALKICWPCLRFIAKRSFSFVLRATNPSKAKPAAAADNALPTPDIFKGMTNLAPAKQVKF